MKLTCAVSYVTSTFKFICEMKNKLIYVLNSNLKLKFYLIYKAEPTKPHTHIHLMLDSNFGTAHLNFKLNYDVYPWLLKVEDVKSKLRFKIWFWILNLQLRIWNKILQFEVRNLNLKSNIEIAIQDNKVRNWKLN